MFSCMTLISSFVHVYLRNRLILNLYQSLLLFTLLIWGGMLRAESLPLPDSRVKTCLVGISTWSHYEENVRGFKDALNANGLSEGAEVIYLEINAQANPQKQQILAEQLMHKRPCLVYSLTTPGTLIIKNVLPETTPVVFSIVTYPADAGLIESLDYSGNNLVGTSNYVPIKQYKYLLEKAFPNARSVAIFRRNKEPNSKIQAANVKRLFSKYGYRVVDVPVNSVDELIAKSRELAQNTDVFFSTTDTLMQSGGEAALIDVSYKTKTPVLSSNMSGVKQGAAAGAVSDLYKLGYSSGEMAAAIIKHGQRPATMRSHFQESPSLLINRQTFKTLGLKLPSFDKEVTYID